VRQRRHPERLFQCSSASRKFLNMISASADCTSAGVSVLFSEPKIPQCWRGIRVLLHLNGFSALQRAENSSIHPHAICAVLTEPFQCSSASRKFLNRVRCPTRPVEVKVSVLFSEPKIPQCNAERRRLLLQRGFSALQRAENSSMIVNGNDVSCITGFSALQRAENSSILRDVDVFIYSPCFSALQRAENSSMMEVSTSAHSLRCFSALQRAENSSIYAHRRLHRIVECFSALQRAENSSIKPEARGLCTCAPFQCSSASRKFLNFGIFPAIFGLDNRFSALQRAENSSILRIIDVDHPFAGFSALQRAENSSIGISPLPVWTINVFQCSSASRKFLNSIPRSSSAAQFRVSVLFSEPKIPQLSKRSRSFTTRKRFQCSSASRKFLNDPPDTTRCRSECRFSALQRAENSSINDTSAPARTRYSFQCSSASRKFLNRM